jgi:hypothetical protein
MQTTLASEAHLAEEPTLIVATSVIYRTGTRGAAVPKREGENLEPR